MEFSTEYKNKVIEALKEQRITSEATDANLARRYGINTSVFSRVMNGETEKILDASKWLLIGKELGITMNQRKWQTAKTDVFKVIEEQILFCKEYSKSRLFVDECEIGKTYTAKYLSRTLPNCFYLDVSQCKTRQLFVRSLAKALGVDFRGTYNEVKDNVKYYLSIIPKPVIILDEFGDANNSVFLELKEFWNATENYCGWYMMGAEGLRYKIERSINRKMIGFAEVLSRFSTRIGDIVPIDQTNKKMFYRKLITDVISVNTDNKVAISTIVNKCLVQVNGKFGGLRRAESLLILNS